MRRLLDDVAAALVVAPTGALLVRALVAGMRRRRVARLLLVNLHATSKPRLVIPWLWAQILLRRADAVLLQECTPRHAARLQRRRRWLLVRGLSDEAILIRRRDADKALVLAGVSPGWWGHQVERYHPGRTLPLVELAGWLDLGSVHLPPGWASGRVEDRHRAGLRYLRRLQRVGRENLNACAFLGGDWQVPPDDAVLEQIRHDLGMTASGHTLDHAAHRGVTVTAWRAIGAGPGMDHRGWLAVVREGED